VKWNSIVFIIGFVIAFAGGYLFFASDSSPTDESTPPEESSTQESTDDEAVDEEADIMAIPEDAQSLSRNGCLSCHSVESLDIQAGNIGPDLTIAYSGVEGKHGKDLDAFLQDPTSAVMATIIADKPLDDDEREQIVAILKKASEEGEASNDKNKDDSDETSNDEEQSD